MRMPLSPDNPNRDRNFIVLVLGGVIVFAIVMGGYILLSLKHQDTDTYVRFLTTLVVVLIPTSLGVWQSFKAKQNSAQAVETAQALREDVHNGVLKDKVKEGVAEVLSGDKGSITYSGGTETEASTQDTPMPGKE
jgi:hypothetical protein